MKTATFITLILIPLVISGMVATRTYAINQQASQEKNQKVEAKPASQTGNNAASSFGSQAAPKLSELPSEAGAWVVHVTTSGGFTGRGAGGASLTSQGKAIFSFMNDSSAINLPADALSRMSEIIALAKPAAWQTLTSSACRDCITTTLTLYRREPDGTQSSHVASWDDTTLEKMPKEVVELYEVVMNLKEKQPAKR